MKKIIFSAVSVILLIVGMAMISISCSQEDEMVTMNIDPELNAFFSTKEFSNFQQSNPFIAENILLDKVHVETFPHDVKQFIIPIMVNGNLKGKLNVFSKKGGKIYHGLYEDWDNMSAENGGVVKISTTDGQYISTLKYTKIKGTKFKVVIQDVASPLNTFQPKTRSETPDPDPDTTKTRSEFPRPDRTDYATCITECYSLAKRYCSSDVGCEFICDLLDTIGQGCATLTIMAACAVYCI